MESLSNFTKKRLRTFWLRISFLAAFILLCPLVAYSITLQWDISTDNRVTGYTIHYGEGSKCPTGISSCNNPVGSYNHQHYVTLAQDEDSQSNTYTWTMGDLDPCISWCFAVDAVAIINNQEVHSDYSNQVGLRYFLNSVFGIKQ